MLDPKFLMLEDLKALMENRLAHRWTVILNLSWKVHCSGRNITRLVDPNHNFQQMIDMAGASTTTKIFLQYCLKFTVELYDYDGQ